MKQIQSFDEWWNAEGSGILPHPHHDMSEHAQYVAHKAWIAALEAVKESLNTEQKEAA